MASSIILMVIVIHQYSEYKGFNGFIREKCLNMLVEQMNNGMMKVITGIRRCGKSYLLFRIFKKYLLNKGADESHIISIELG